MFSTNTLSSNGKFAMTYIYVRTYIHIYIYMQYMYRCKTVNHFYYTLVRFEKAGGCVMRRDGPGKRGRGADIIVIRWQSSDWFTHGWSLKALSSDTGESHSMNHRRQRVGGRRLQRATAVSPDAARIVVVVFGFMRYV